MLERLLSRPQVVQPSDELARAPGDEREARRAERKLWDGVVIRQAAGMWLAARLAFAVLTYFAVAFNAQGSTGINTTRFPPHRLLAAWGRWDTGWYIGIAEQGYHDKLSTAFFPLYSLLIHLVISVTGNVHALAAAMIISNLGTLAAFVALGLLANSEYGRVTARYAVLAFAAFPLAFFTVGGYSDGLFLGFAFFCLLFARRGMWIPAMLCAFFATMTRLFGLVLVLPLLWEYARQVWQPGMTWRDLGRARTLRLLAPGVAVAAAPVLGLAVCCAYLWVHNGDPFSYFHVQRTYWDHYSITPWRWLRSAWDALRVQPTWSFPQARILFDLAPVLIFGALAVATVRRMPVSFVLYIAGTFAICLSSSVPLNFVPMTGQGRYMLMCAPLFILLGRWMARRPTLEMFVVGGGFLLQGLFATFFLRGGWLV